MVAGTAVLLVIATVDLLDGEEGPPPAGETVQQVTGDTAPPASSGSDVVLGPRVGERRRRQGKPPAVTPPPVVQPPDPDGECANEDVVVTPVMAPATAGRPVLVSLDLHTLESRACTWKLGPERLAYKITADGEDVWSSADCAREVPGDEVVVRRDFATTYRLAWSGRPSRHDCPGGMAYVAPGDYEVQAAAIGGEPSEPVPFTLSAPAEPEPEPADGQDEAKGGKQRKRGQEPFQQVRGRGPDRQGEDRETPGRQTPAR